MGTVEENKEILRHQVDEINKGNLEVLSEYHAPDCIYHDNTRLLVGADAYKESIARAKAAFPDLYVTINNIIGEDDYLAIRYTQESTFTKKFHNWEPNGKRIKYETQELYQFKDGKIVEVWSIYDDLDLLRQLGAIPTN